MHLVNIPLNVVCQSTNQNGPFFFDLIDPFFSKVVANTYYVLYTMYYVRNM